MTRGILFLIEEARRLVLSDASADDVLDILAELNDNTKARLAALSSPCACEGRKVLAAMEGAMLESAVANFAADKVRTIYIRPPDVASAWPHNYEVFVRVIILADEPQGGANG